MRSILIALIFAVTAFPRSGCVAISPDEKLLSEAIEGGHTFLSAPKANIRSQFLKCFLRDSAYANLQTIYISGVLFSGYFDISNIEVHPMVIFEQCTFNDGFLAKQATFDRDLVLIDTSTTPPGDPGGDFDLTGANFHGNLTIRGGQIHKVDASGIHVSGSLIIDRLKAKFVDLTYSNVGRLSWTLADSDAKFAKDSVYADDLSFSKSTFLKPDKYKKLQDATEDFLEHVTFSGPLFLEMERHLRDEGNPGGADDVFLLMHQRQRQAEHSFWRRSADWLYCYVFGYGRFAIWPLTWSALFVVFATILFWNADKRKTVQAVDEALGKQVPFSGFWYSLEMFVPFVDLGVGKGWRPQTEFLSTYARVHQFAGWILIPVAIGAITGAFK